MKNRNNSSLFHKTRSFCETQDFYTDGEKTLVGFSGGADSVCLLHVLNRLLGADRLVAVHINHMLRGDDADADEAFCRTFCAEHGIPFQARKIDVTAICGGSGFEKAARDVRYAAFEEEAAKSGCGSVSLAHTASDNLETMIFHLCRGAGLSGLSGIPPKRPLGEIRVVRPLLTCSRDEIMAYIRENQLSYRTDSTNSDTHYTRNFIRHEVVPLLKQINPASEANAGASAFTAASAADFIRGEAGKIIERQHIQREASTELLSSLHPALFYGLLAEMYQNAGGDTLYSVQAEAVYKLIQSDKKGRHVELTGDIIAVIDGGMLRVLPKKEYEKESFVANFSVKLHTGENTLPGGNKIFIGTVPPADLTKAARFSAHANLPKASLDTLLARSRRNGESYHAGGMTRTLKKLLCGEPLIAKRYRPVICDTNGILWFPGTGIADGKICGDLTDVFYLEF